MNRNSIMLGLGVLAVIAIFLVAMIQFMKSSHGDGKIEADIQYNLETDYRPPMSPQYEYIVVETNIDVTPAKQLNKFGEKGWLLLQVQRVPPNGKIYLTFAREKQ